MPWPTHSASNAQFPRALLRVGRTLLLFFAVGGALYVLKDAWQRFAPSSRIELKVWVAKDAGPLAVDRAVEEAVLVQLAVAGGGAMVDPVVREALLQSMRRGSSAGDSSDAFRASATESVDGLLTRRSEHLDDDVLVERAIRLGLHISDPVVRQRLAFQSQQVLMAEAETSAPSDASLATYVAAHQERYEAPPTLSLIQVFIAPTRHPDGIDSVVEALRAKLALRGPEEAWTLGDPSLLPGMLTDADPRLVDARFGAGFYARLADAPLSQFFGPVQSSYGLHFVFIQDRRAAGLPPLAQLRARALADYRHDQREALFQKRLKALRERYRVAVQRIAP